MRVLVDTNLFIDILLAREPWVESSARVYKLCENGMIDGYIAPITINNIHYICRKAKQIDLIKAFLTDISSAFTIAPMDSDTIRKANTLHINDYEDALQYTMAAQSNCQYLITRNIKDYKGLNALKVVTPEAFLEIL